MSSNHTRFPACDGKQIVFVWRVVNGGGGGCNKGVERAEQGMRVPGEKRDSVLGASVEGGASSGDGCERVAKSEKEERKEEKRKRRRKEEGRRKRKDTEKLNRRNHSLQQIGEIIDCSKSVGPLFVCRLVARLLGGLRKSEKLRPGRPPLGGAAGEASTDEQEWWNQRENKGSGGRGGGEEGVDGVREAREGGERADRRRSGGKDGPCVRLRRY